MAAPTKEGLKYWPLDIDFDADEKLQYAMDQLSFKSDEIWKKAFVPMVYVYVLNEIYRNGYYRRWNDKLTLKVAKKTHVLRSDEVKVFISAFIKSGLFSFEIYFQHEVLTSYGVQKRWKKISHWLDRKVSSISADLEVVPENHPDLHSNTPSIMELIGGGNHSFPFIPINTTNSIDNSKEEETKNSNHPPKTELMGGDNGVNGVVKQEDNLVITPEEPSNHPPKTELMGGDNKKVSKRVANTINKQKGEFEIDECLRMYFDDESFVLTRDPVVNMLPVDAQMPPEAKISRLRKFAEAFNRDMAMRGEVVMTMRGNSGWCVRFSRWLPYVKNIRDVDPDTLYTSIDNKSKKTESAESKPRKYTNPNYKEQ